MRVLLVAPPEKWVHGMILPRVDVPLGLLYVAACIKDEFDVSVYDSTLKRKFTKTAFGFSHFGENWDEVKDRIRREKPDIVGVSNLSSMQFSYAVKTCEVAKEVDSEIKTVVGGPHATVRPQDFLKYDCIDYTVNGEGEYSFRELLGRISKGYPLRDVCGIGFKEKWEVKVNATRPPLENLDELPYPAYDLIDLREYFKVVEEGFGTRPDQFSRTSKEIPIITSRGCPYNCVFCTVYCHMGKLFRPHTSEYILKHLEYLVEKYDVKHVHFEDDNLILDKKRFNSILDGLIENGFDLTWDTPNGVRADHLDKKLLEKMKASGVTQLKVGVESAQKHILDGVIDKRLDLNNVVESARLCSELSIPLGAFYVIGFPSESKEDITATLNFAFMLLEKYGTRPHISVAVPYYGTRLYKLCKEKNLLLREPMDNFDLKYSLTEGIIKTEEFAPADLRTYVRRFYRRVLTYYISKTIKSPYEIWRILDYSVQNMQTALRVANIGFNYYLRY